MEVEVKLDSFKLMFIAKLLIYVFYSLFILCQTSMLCCLAID